jgi:hypothetical protein
MQKQHEKPDAREALRAELPGLRRWAADRRADGNMDAARLAEILVELGEILVERPVLH